MRIFRVFKYAVCCMIVLTFIAQGGSCVYARGITVASAANARFPVKEIARMFTDETGIDTRLVFASTGKIESMIKKGAPFDVFLPADMNTADRMYEEGYSVFIPEVIAYGDLVVWFKDKTANNMKVRDALLSGKVRKIGIGVPSLARYGAAAENVIKAWGVEEELGSKLVYGVNIGQVVSFAVAGAVDAAFIPKSFLYGRVLRGVWKEVDGWDRGSLAQSVVVLKNGRPYGTPEADSFRKFITGDEAVYVFEKYGYRRGK